MSLRLLGFAVLALPLLGAAACASAPPFAGLTADDLFALGQAEFEEEDWDEAAEVLDHLLLRVAGPTFERAADARFMLAQAYFNAGDYLSSQSEFTRFLDRFPSDERRARAALGICQSFAGMSPIAERDQTNTVQAVGICRNVVQDYSGIDDEVAAEAQEIFNEMRSKLGHKEYKNSMHYFDREWWFPAIVYFEIVVEQYGDTEWAPRAIARMIEAYREVGYEEEVEQWRQTLLNSYPDSPEAKSLANGLGADTTTVGG
jgi:outer membrane protein assembly factor BamD